MFGLKYRGRGKEKPAVAVVSSLSELNPLGANAHTESLVRILMPSVDRVYILAATFPAFDEGNILKVKVRKYGDKQNDFILLKFLRYLLTDFKLSLKLVSISKHVDIVMYGSRSYFLATLTSKLLGKKCIVFAFNSLARVAKELVDSRSMISMIKDGIFPPVLMGLLDTAVLTLADRVWIESSSVIDFAGLHKYKRKIFVCGAIYIDTEHLKVRRKLDERENIIGYIGRLGETKRVLNIVKAIPMVVGRYRNAKFFFGGGGPLMDELENEIKSNELEKVVEVAGWVSRSELPYQLNRIKLFVLPSATEGLPRALREAMACGAVVLATPVGGIPDLIKDGETGFILEDGSPECIARTIVKALGSPRLGDIVQNAETLIRQEYSYSAMATRCRLGLSDLMV